MSEVHNNESWLSKHKSAQSDQCDSSRLRGIAAPAPLLTPPVPSFPGFHISQRLRTQGHKRQGNSAQRPCSMAVSQDLPTNHSTNRCKELYVCKRIVTAYDSTYRSLVKTAKVTGAESGIYKEACVFKSVFSLTLTNIMEWHHCDSR